MIKVAGFVCLPFLLMYAQAGGDAPVLEVASTPTVESHENALGETVAAQAIAQDVRNISSKCVLGFVLKVELFNASGKSMGRHARLVFRGKKLGCLESGQTVHMPHSFTLPLDSAGNPATYITSVDFVAFTDGTKWGPAALPQASELLGMVEASGLAK